MGLYSEISGIWKQKPEEWSSNQRQRLIEWRHQEATVRIEKPTRLDRARALGYKAKKGFVVIRQRVKRGGRQNPKIRKTRSGSNMSRIKTLSKNYQQVAEERVAKKHPNLEVLNSYFAGKDGKHYWYEVVMLDRSRPEVQSDKDVSRAAAKRGRAFRGLTSAARKSSGRRKKGLGTEKTRPSLRAHSRRK